MCNRFLQVSQTCNSRAFEKWGSLLASSGWLFLLIGSIVMVGLSIGYINAKEFSHSLKSLSPLNGEERDFFDTYESVDFPEFEAMSFIYKAKNDENVLTIPHIQKVFAFHSHLLAYNNAQLRNQDCYQILGLCIYLAHINDLYSDATGNPIFPGSLTTDAQLVTQINTATNPNLGSKVSIGGLFGGTTPENIAEDHSTSLFNLQEAKAIKSSYFLKIGQQFSPLYEQATKEFLAQSGNEDIDITIFSTVLFKQEAAKSAKQDAMLVVAGGLLFLIYTITFASTCHPIGFRSTTVLIALLVAVCSTLTAYAVCSFGGLRYAAVHMLLFFFLIFQGLYHLFTLTAHVDQINNLSSLTQRITGAMKLGGSSLFLAAVTSFSAIILSSFTQIESIRSFLIYFAVGVVFNFLYTMTAFAGYFAIDTKRQLNNRGDWCGGCRCRPHNCFFCCGKVRNYQAMVRQPKAELTSIVHNQSIDHLDKNDTNELPTKQMATVPASGTSDFKRGKTQSKYVISTKITDKKTSSFAPENTYTIKGSYVQYWLSRHFSRFINHTITQIIVLLLTLVLAAISGWAVTQVKTDLPAIELINDKQSIKPFLVDNQHYFPNEGPLVYFVTTDESDLRTAEQQNKLLTALNTYRGASTCTFCEQSWVLPGTTSSWYFAFLAFAGAGACNGICGGSCMDGNIVNETYMPQCLQAFFTSAGAIFSQTLALYETDGSQVTKMKHTVSLFSLSNPKGTKDQVQMMKDARRIASEIGPGGSFLTAIGFFNIESYEKLEEEIGLILAIPLIGILLISFAFSGSFISSLFIMIVAGLVELNLYGFIGYADISLNAISLPIFIGASLLTVYNSVLITKAFDLSTTELKGNTNRVKRKDKVKAALSRSGAPVIHVSLAILLFILGWAGSKTYVFLSFFLLMFGAIVFSLLHSLFLLPVLLSFFGTIQQRDTQIS